MCLFHIKGTEHLATSSAVFKHFRSAVQFMYCAVLLTVRLAALKDKLLTELLAVLHPTLTNHTEFKEVN